MNSRTPSRKTRFKRAILQLVASACFVGLACQSGCAVLSIPSYRADSYAGGEHSMAESSSGTAVLDECDEARYEPVFPVPALPAIPTPGFIKRWKEHKNLPEGPKGLKFHPLPTRPMFQPKPGSAPMNPDWDCAEIPSDATHLHGPDQFGIVPQRSQWSNVTQPESNPVGSGTIDSTKQGKAPTASLSEPTPVEEIPRPN